MGSYRCFLHYGHQVAETGVLPYLQLKAPSAESAARQALAVSGADAVVEVIRIEARHA